MTLTVDSRRSCRLEIGKSLEYQISNIFGPRVEKIIEKKSYKDTVNGETHELYRMQVIYNKLFFYEGWFNPLTDHFEGEGTLWTPKGFKYSGVWENSSLMCKINPHEVQIKQ